jgi:chromosome segregation ATPase
MAMGTEGKSGRERIAQHLADARAELDQAKRRIAEIEEGIRKLEEEKSSLESDVVYISGKVAGLERLAGEEIAEYRQERSEQWKEFVKLGLQECCYQVLVEDGGEMDANEIMERLERRGMDMKRYANPLAVIHTSLKRIPDRVRSFKQKLQHENNVTQLRVYKAVGTNEAGALAPPKNSTARR